jgi:hypothetical protein
MLGCAESRALGMAVSRLLGQPGTVVEAVAQVLSDGISVPFALETDQGVGGTALLVEGTVAPLTPGKLEATYAELRVPRYRRGFTLSRELDAEHIDANLKDGVLRLRIPKQAHAQPRRIQIQTA